MIEALIISEHIFLIIYLTHSMGKIILTDFMKLL